MVSSIAKKWRSIWWASSAFSSNSRLRSSSNFEVYLSVYNDAIQLNPTSQTSYVCRLLLLLLFLCFPSIKSHWHHSWRTWRGYRWRLFQRSWSWWQRKDWFQRVPGWFMLIFFDNTRLKIDHLLWRIWWIFIMYASNGIWVLVHSRSWWER